MIKRKNVRISGWIKKCFVFSANRRRVAPVVRERREYAADNAPDVNEGTWRLMIEGLFTTVTNVNFNEKTLRELIDRVHCENARLVPDCAVCDSACGRTDDYDMEKLWSAQEDIRSLKSLILFGVRGMAAYAHHAMVLGYTDEEVNRFFAKALFVIGEDLGMDELLPIVMEVGEKNLKCMALLDKANTETYGTPTPVITTADDVYVDEYCRNYRGWLHRRHNERRRL